MCIVVTKLLYMNMVCCNATVSLCYHFVVVISCGFGEAA